jgi:hypothetical protein
VLLVDIEPLVERLPNSRTLAPASSFPPASAEQQDAPAGPTIDPRHAALAALLVTEHRPRGSEDLQKQARTMLSALDLLGGAWLASPPVADVRSVVDSLRFRDQVIEVLKPLLVPDAAATAWLDLLVSSARGEGNETRWLPYDLRIVAKLAEAASAIAPDRLPDHDARRLAVAACNAALACERSVTWAEGSHERTVRENIQRTWSDFLGCIQAQVGDARGEAEARSCERSLATWSRTKGPETPDVVVNASRRPLEVMIDTSSPSTFWEGFTDGGPFGGVFVATYNQRREGERVVLELVIEGTGRHRALGIVRWIRAAASNVEPGLGVELVDASSALEARIRAFTRRRAPLRNF